MQELFVPYELAVKLKELGFDEYCLCKYNASGDLVTIGCYSDSHPIHLAVNQSDICEAHVLAPLYQQVFDWLCKRINLSTTSWSLEFTESGWDIIHVDKATYEIIDIFRNEAALNKLIKIVENETKSKIN